MWTLMKQQGQFNCAPISRLHTSVFCGISFSVSHATLHLRNAIQSAVPAC